MNFIDYIPNSAEFRALWPPHDWARGLPGGLLRRKPASANWLKWYQFQIVSAHDGVSVPQRASSRRLASADRVFPLTDGSEEAKAGGLNLGKARHVLW